VPDQTRAARHLAASSTPAELVAKIHAQDTEIGLLREEIEALRAEVAMYNRALTAACRAAGLDYPGDGADGSRTAPVVRLVPPPESLPARA